jgi:putative ABC transport system permease protein
MLFERGTLGVGDNTTTLQYRAVAPGFFETMGIPLISGRQFQVTDKGNSLRVAIINESLARRYFHDQEPIGKVLKFGTEASDSAQIIGVVGDTRDVHLNAPPRPQIYLPALQAAPEVLHLFVRSSYDPAALAADLRNAVWSVDKDQPIKGIQTMSAVIDHAVAQPRFRTWLVGVFAALGLTLTLVGVYGVISYSASQRTREIGIRVALGAQPGNVLRLVLQQGIRLAIAGAILGVIGSLALSRVLKSQLFEISPADPLTLVGAAVIMLLVALAACYIPARRATLIDPLEALRQE